jgi:hypothetical protein
MTNSSILIDSVVVGGQTAASALNIIVEGWKKTKDGYEAEFGKDRARLTKGDGGWVLHFRGKTYSMPKRRASFDHAEGIISAELSK